jgi:serine/threonine-protein phosphatase 2A regulatory subunit B
MVLLLSFLYHFLIHIKTIYFYNNKDKTVKLWKVSNNARKTYQPRAVASYAANKELLLPKCIDPPGISPPRPYATQKRVYSNAHTYHINSLSLNTDGETFISADDLRINWWNLDYPDTCFSKIYFIFFSSLFCLYFLKKLLE